MLQSKEYILRTMNYHTKEMVLQKLLASIIGCLGLDSSSSDGLMPFVEQLKCLLVDLSGAGQLRQLTQLVQLVGNLILVDGMLTQDAGDALFKVLLEACYLLQSLPVMDTSAEDRAAALKVRFYAL